MTLKAGWRLTLLRPDSSVALHRELAAKTECAEVVNASALILERYFQSLPGQRARRPDGGATASGHSDEGNSSFTAQGGPGASGAATSPARNGSDRETSSAPDLASRHESRLTAPGDADASAAAAATRVGSGLSGARDAATSSARNRSGAAAAPDLASGRDSRLTAPGGAGASGAEAQSLSGPATPGESGAATSPARTRPAAVSPSAATLASGQDSRLTAWVALVRLGPKPRASLARPCPVNLTLQPHRLETALVQ